jgi:hypothetical protein
MGFTAAGKKELIDIADGYRESEQSWQQLLLSLQARGMTVASQLAVADGVLGFWGGACARWGRPPAVSAGGGSMAASFSVRRLAASNPSTASGRWPRDGRSLIHTCWQYRCEPSLHLQGSA